MLELLESTGLVYEGDTVYISVPLRSRMHWLKSTAELAGLFVNTV